MILRALAKIYSGKECDISMNRDFSLLSKMVKNKGRAIMKMLLPMLGKYKNPKLLSLGDGFASEVIETKIDAKTISIAHAKAKEMGATMNDVFMTSLAMAINRYSGAKKIGFPCTVDLRKYNPKEAGVGNLTGSYEINIKTEKIFVRPL